MTDNAVRRPMQMLWLSHVIPYPPKAGVLQRAYYLLRSVAEMHEVDLVAFVQTPYLTTFFPSVEEGLHESKAALGKFCRSVTLLPIENIERPYGKARTALASLFSRECYMARWLYGECAHQELSRLSARNSYDLVHFDVISLAPYRKLFAATVATLGYHNIESHMLLRRAGKESRWLQKFFFWQEGIRLARFEKQVADEFAGHITCSDLDSARLKEMIPCIEPLAIPNGVDVEYFQPRKGNVRENSLIFVGTLSWYPNVDAILYLLREIWPALRRELPDVTLDIVGAGAPAEVTQLAGASPGVRLHGFVPDFRPLIDTAAVYVCPIRDGGGTKLKILDALAMAKCVVAHPIACEGINVVDGESVVLAAEPLDFVRQIVALLADAARRETIGAAARQLAVSEYAVESIGRRLAAYLQDIASGSAGSKAASEPPMPARERS